eukprot:8820462-Heterocapsa_arctica.AAC.1
MPSGASRQSPIMASPSGPPNPPQVGSRRSVPRTTWGTKLREVPQGRRLPDEIITLVHSPIAD